jgi:hypothetical protein
LGERLNIARPDGTVDTVTSALFFMGRHPVSRTGVPSAIPLLGALPLFATGLGALALPVQCLNWAAQLSNSLSAWATFLRRNDARCFIIILPKKPQSLCDSLVEQNLCQPLNNSWPIFHSSRLVSLEKRTCPEHHGMSAYDPNPLVERTPPRHSLRGSQCRQ